MAGSVLVFREPVKVPSESNTGSLNLPFYGNSLAFSCRIPITQVRGSSKSPCRSTHEQTLSFFVLLSLSLLPARAVKVSTNLLMPHNWSLDLEVGGWTAHGPTLSLWNDEAKHEEQTTSPNLFAQKKSCLRKTFLCPSRCKGWVDPCAWKTGIWTLPKSDQAPKTSNNFLTSKNVLTI